MLLTSTLLKSKRWVKIIYASKSSFLFTQIFKINLSHWMNFMLRSFLIFYNRSFLFIKMKWFNSCLTSSTLLSIKTLCLKRCKNINEIEKSRNVKLFKEMRFFDWIENFVWRVELQINLFSLIKVLFVNELMSSLNVVLKINIHFN